jgi:transketolase
VLPEGVRKRVAVEMGVAMGWEKYVGEDGVVLSIEGYGASAPYQTILQEYGFTVENVYQQAKQLLDQKR